MIERVDLFQTKQDIVLFFLFVAVVLFYSLLIEYNNYKHFKAFDTVKIDAIVLKHYTKMKKAKKYYLLKMRSSDGVTFYTSVSKKYKNLQAQKVKYLGYVQEISFLEYLRGFYLKGRISQVLPDQGVKYTLMQKIQQQHSDKDAQDIYKALFLALPFGSELQKIFSSLGVSHLIAISGLHIGIISALFYFLFRPFYSFFQSRYFPYRNYTRDAFVSLGVLLFCYTYFLDMPPSLLRSFGMFLIGYILYDRGFKIISMQTLFVSVVLLLAFFPRLLFSMGFFLSVAGVFYIFVFLKLFDGVKKVYIFLWLPFWIYLMMLPYSVVMFQNFSLLHPLSIVWSVVFNLFYPVSFALHLFGFGDLFDGVLSSFIAMGKIKSEVDVSVWWLGGAVLLSLLTLYKRWFAYLLVLCNLCLFIVVIEQVA